jgi:hypothetical protein
MLLTLIEDDQFEQNLLLQNTKKIMPISNHIDSEHFCKRRHITVQHLF